MADITPLEAARIGDQIEHTFAMTGLLAGLVVGLVVTGGILLAAGATVATGGAAAVVIGGLVAGVAGGGLAGMKIGKMFTGTKGPISIPGSPNTFIGDDARKAARAIIDQVACTDHPPLKPIATGALHVYINNKPAARKTDKTICDGKIAEGHADVFFGGPTGQYMPISSEVPGWLVTTLEWAAIIGTVVATGGAILTVGFGAAMGGLAAGYLGGLVGAEVGGRVGEHFFGEKGKVIGEVLGEYAGSFWASAKGEKLGAKLEGALRPGVKTTPDHIVQQANDYITNQVPKNDYSLTPGKDPSLWTGEGALNAARKSGHGTMEDTAGGKATEQFVKGIKDQSTWDVQKPIWVESSKSYVHEIGKQYGTINPETGLPISGPNSGKEVTVFVSDKANPKSVYYTVEKPLLQSYGVKINEVPVRTFHYPGGVVATDANAARHALED